jgi:phenylacetaldehyde dehydrogenase
VVECHGGRSRRVTRPARGGPLLAQRHQLLIDGQWLDAASGETFATLDPAIEQDLTRVARGGTHDIDLAVKAARRAFDDGSAWRRMSPSERGRLIHRIADLILEHGDELAMLESLDSGKPVAVARAADVVLAADLFHYTAGWATKIEGNTIDISALPAPGEYPAFTLREPVGVALLGYTSDCLVRWLERRWLAWQPTLLA